MQVFLWILSMFAVYLRWQFFAVMASPKNPSAQLSQATPP